MVANLLAKSALCYMQTLACRHANSDNDIIFQIDPNKDGCPTSTSSLSIRAAACSSLGLANALRPPNGQFGAAQLRLLAQTR